jgi:hypothetical protein
MPEEIRSMHLSAAGNAPTERREGADRRRHNWRTVTYCGLHRRGRRRQVRRHNQSYYLDYYDGRLVLTGILVLLLSAVDALLTLTLLNQGAYEANYLMARLLEIGDRPFVITKTGVTAAGVLFLLMHANFRIFRLINVKQVLRLLVGVYGLLIGWELLLLDMLA